MGEFVNQHRAEFARIEQPIDASGKEDTRGKNSANCRTRMPVVEAHWNAICHEVRCDATIAQKGWRLCLATLSAYARDQSHEHKEGPGHPYNSEDHGGFGLFFFSFLACFFLLFFFIFLVLFLC